MKKLSLKIFSLLSLLVLILGMSVQNQAHASDEFAARVQALDDESFTKKIEAINVLAGSNHERAVRVLNAMDVGLLFTLKSDNTIVIAEPKSDVYVIENAITGEALGQVQKSDLKKIKMNNRVRGVIKGVLGGMTLLSKDYDIRKKAINAVFVSRTEDLLPILEQALAREEDKGLKSRLQLTVAAINLENSKDETVLLKALDVLQETPIPDVRSILSGFIASSPSEKMKIAAQATLDSVENSLSVWEYVGNLYRGLSLGSVLLLAAVGLAITFGVMGVINMAHGEMVMLGAYSTFVVQEVFRNYMPELFDWSLLVAIPFAFLVAGSVGVAMERGIIRFLYGRPLETLLATWGVSLMLQQLMRTIFGPTNQDVSSPHWMSGAIEFSNGLSFTYNRLWIIVFSLLVVAGVTLILRKTYFGLQMRAVTQNRAMANSMGIKSGWVDAMTFGLGSGIAGMAGVALSQIDNVSPNLGQAYIIDSFMVVVFGGVGNIMGTVVGAFSLGIVNKFMEPMAGAVLAKILVLIALILFIQKRPRGLFALKGRSVEA
jgi:urea transport system permease protein